jgi:PhzF family phenazine biosynthesis protein
VPIRQHESGWLAFAAPPLERSGPLEADELDRVARFLRIEPSAIVDAAWCDNGPGWRGVLLRSADEVLALRPDPLLVEGLDVGVAGPYPAGSQIAVEIRTFFAGTSGLTEDPVTGSFNAAVAQWLVPGGVLPSSYRAAQGTRLGRAGRISIDTDEAGTWVGGHCVTVIDGHVEL